MAPVQNGSALWVLPAFPGNVCEQVPSEELGYGDLLTFTSATLSRVVLKGLRYATVAVCGKIDPIQVLCERLADSLREALVGSCEGVG